MTFLRVKPPHAQSGSWLHKRASVGDSENHLSAFVKPSAPQCEEGTGTPPSSPCGRRAERVAGRAAEVQAARGVPFGMKTEGGRARSPSTPETLKGGQGAATGGGRDLARREGVGTGRSPAHLTRHPVESESSPCGAVEG